MSAIRIAALVAATLATGLTAGVFYAYAISVMPAFARMDDRVVIEAMQRINIVIINPAFMVGFLGTVGFTFLAAVSHLDSRPTLWWIGIALVLDLVAFGITAGCNVPLNDQLAAAGDPAALPDPGAVRAAFEPRWVRWNIVRGVLHGLAFLVLCGALFDAGVRHGQESAHTDGRFAGMARTDMGTAAYDRSHR